MFGFLVWKKLELGFCGGWRTEGCFYKWGFLSVGVLVKPVIFRNFHVCLAPKIVQNNCLRAVCKVFGAMILHTFGSRRVWGDSSASRFRGPRRSLGHQQQLSRVRALQN